MEARIQNYELAARMQLAATDVLDVSKESEATKKLYGIDNPVSASYGQRCLMARRLIEAGVRFVQIHPGPGQPWDNHAKLREKLSEICAKTDQPVAGLLKDLKSRGLMESTILLWAGEFGRLPTTQNSDGRDHNRNAFSLWLAGGGFKEGLIYGATDEFGLPVHGESRRGRRPAGHTAASARNRSQAADRPARGPGRNPHQRQHHGRAHRLGHPQESSAGGLTVRLSRLVVPLSILSALSTAIAFAQPSFERDVEPIFKTNCYSCHGGTAMVGLDLRTATSILRGSHEGPVVVKAGA